MQKRLLSIFVGVLFLMGGRCSYGEGSDGEKISVDDPVLSSKVFAGLTKYLRDLSSWDLSITRTPIVSKNLPVDNSEGKAVGTLRFYFQGEKYRMENIFTPSDELLLSQRISTYDGSTQEVLRCVDGFLSIRKIDKDFKKAPMTYYRYKNPVLMLFQFLSLDLLQDDGAELLISDLKKVGVEEALRNRVVSVRKLSVEGDTQWVLEVKGGVEFFTNLPSVYRVYLSEKHAMLPVRWERFSSEGKRIWECEVNSFEDAFDVRDIATPYPAKITTKYYGGSKEYPTQNDPVTTIEWGAKLNSINTSIDNDLFTIDPAIATSIYDVNSNTSIPVPK